MQAVTDALEKATEYRTEFRIVRPDEGVRHLTACGKVYLGEDGRPQRITGVTWDVTEQRQAEGFLQTRDGIAHGGLTAV